MSWLLKGERDTGEVDWATAEEQYPGCSAEWDVFIDGLGKIINLRLSIAIGPTDNERHLYATYIVHFGVDNYSNARTSQWMPNGEHGAWQTVYNS